MDQGPHTSAPELVDLTGSSDDTESDEDDGPREPENARNDRPVNIKVPIKVQNTKELVCPICFTNLLQITSVVTTPCGHLFCKQCLFQALEENNSCPYCREIVHVKDVRVVKIGHSK